MELISRGAIPNVYQASFPDPNTFQPEMETTTDGTVEAILY